MPLLQHSDSPALVAQDRRSVVVDSVAACRSAVTAWLHDDLLQLVTGIPDPRARTGVTWQRLYGQGSEVVARITKVHNDLLATATPRLVSTYGFNLEAELSADSLGIEAGCAST
jgi:hypothetical protein